ENVRNLGIYEVLGYHQGIAKHLRDALDRLQPRQIAINYSLTDVSADGLTHGMFLSLQEILQGTVYGDRFISAEQIIAAVRGRKSPAEVARMRQAIVFTQQLFDEVEQFVRPGMTQRQIANFVHQRADALGLGYA